MKTLWNGFIILAIANLLALGGFIGWLVSSDRLNMDRIRQIRMVLSITISEQAAKEASEQAKVAQDKKTADEAAKAAKPPLTAAEKLAARVEATQLDQERASRLRREVEALQSRLASDSEKLSKERQQLDADKAAFAATVAAQSAKTDDEQFQKSLGVLVGLKPAAAKTMLMQMMGTGSASTAQPSAQPGAQAGDQNQQASSADTKARLKQAVAYLNAMEERPRSKIMAEFAKDDPRLAADLLDNLRAFGQLAKTSDSPPGTGTK
ncbi:MAG: hypothetical protein JSR77_08820 [Planctomycetes bacterium]|nr:hypothetical protein [Planctomycetota bacterium]